MNFSLFLKYVLATVFNSFCCYMVHFGFIREFMISFLHFSPDTLEMEKWTTEWHTLATFQSGKLDCMAFGTVFNQH